MYPKVFVSVAFLPPVLPSVGLPNLPNCVRMGREPTSMVIIIKDSLPSERRFRNWRELMIIEVVSLR